MFSFDPDDCEWHAGGAGDQRDWGELTHGARNKSGWGAASDFDDGRGGNVVGIDENNDHHHLFNHHRHHHQQVRAVMGPNCQSKIHLELLGKGLATMKMFTIIIIINIIIHITIIMTLIIPLYIQPCSGRRWIHKRRDLGANDPTGVFHFWSYDHMIGSLHIFLNSFLPFLPKSILITIGLDCTCPQNCPHQSFS